MLVKYLSSSRLIYNNLLPITNTKEKKNFITIVYIQFHRGDKEKVTNALQFARSTGGTILLDT